MITVDPAAGGNTKIKSIVSSLNSCVWVVPVAKEGLQGGQCGP